MKYYVVSPDNRKVLFGPYDNRQEADTKHYEVCSQGIPNTVTGAPDRPRCAVVCEDALVPNDHGNHFQFQTAETAKAKVN